ncbi:MAG TPA: Stk1 family PASTA domain-containing Ser/Thr kinase [Actinomycetota bacterium]|nr:Stk1 family PASTA domain-containing Ser/Thr kinase [Actinomycetota bacterium]
MSADGKTYGGRYQVIERVGLGGMAEVYRARDDLLGREVAVKVLSDRLSSDKSFVERFRREAQAAANLSHPNIVSLYDYGSDEGANFIVMELIDGRGLEAVISDDGPLLPERAAEIASDVARALERAHTTGLVHRDIKPSNIMITSYGQTKVTDFGIARALGDGEQTMTQTGMVIGTASYLSPEQAQGNPVDVRSDVYALGCVLYEMLTGRPPFTGDTPLSIAYKHVRENPEKPSGVNGDIPAALDAIVMKALAKNPDNRYQTAREMREDLERFTSGQKVLATPLLAEATTVGPAGTGTQVIDRYDEWDDEPEERNRAGLYVLAALVILGLFALLAYLLANNLLGGEDAQMVEVPDVVGDREAAAISTLEDAGFEVDVVDRRSNSPAGRVIAQDPEGGERLEEGEIVEITVSEGRRQTMVPDLVGLTQEEAEDAIEDAKLTVGEVTTEPSDELEEGRVISQSPEPDEEVDVRSEVDLVVSGGPEAVRVPSVIGQSEETAVQEIEAAGLSADVLTAPSDQDEGVVIAQDPEGGAEAEPGDIVTITVSEGAEEREMPDVTGQDADDAEAFLESEFGLNVSQAEEACAAATPPGTVCRQEPEPGTPVAEGDSATLYVQPGDAALPGWGAALAGLLLWFGR